MNPELQVVLSRIVSELNRRCKVCDGRLVLVVSGKHRRRRCERCGADLPAHHTNFLDAVRGDAKALNADVTAGHLSASIVHLANIAARTGKVLEFDPKSEKVTNDAAANALVRREYRDHWGTPKGV